MKLKCLSVFVGVLLLFSSINVFGAGGAKAQGTGADKINIIWQQEILRA